MLIMIIIIIDYLFTLERFSLSVESKTHLRWFYITVLSD